MRFEKTITVPTSVDRAWDLLMDMPEVGTCVPGLETVEEIGPDTYRGVMKVKVGAMRVTFNGEIKVIETNREDLRAKMEAKGADKRVGGAMNATVDMSLREIGSEEVEMTTVADAAVLGKLGELGQAVMMRKADQIMTRFAENLAAKLRGEEPAGAAAPAKPGLWARIMAWFRRDRAAG